MDYGLICERLIQARELVGYNRKDFADFLKMPYRTITNYENGSREPGSDYLAKVADICGCTTDWLLGLSDEVKGASDLSLSPGDPVFETLQENYQELNEEGRERLADYSDDLVRSGKYIKNHQSKMDSKEA